MTAAEAKRIVTAKPGSYKPPSSALCPACRLVLTPQGQMCKRCRSTVIVNRSRMR
jgi:hypothetical protein